MRIAFVGGRGVPALYGGFETAATEIGYRLVERGHEVTVYCREGYGDETELEYRGIRKIFMPRIRMQAVETLSHTFASMVHIWFHAPDVLIVLNPANGPLCIFPRLRGIPFAVHVDGLDWERGKWPWYGRKYIYWAARFSTWIAPAIIADSHGIQKFYKEKWNKESHYASYGTYLVESEEPALLEEYGLTPDDYFLVVARMEPENNTDLIVEAFKKVKTDKKLVIVGGTHYEGAYSKKLRELGESDPRIQFMGGIYERRRLREIMCNAYAYVHGHQVGGTNPILLKALGCGAAVLYLDVIFNAEVVGDAGKAFPREVNAAAEVLQEAVDHPERVASWRERTRARVSKEYCWERATDDYETLCMTLASKKSRTEPGEQKKQMEKRT
ncbi:MAG: glycosyl transferase [Candidatus Hydrogenedentota bacterium]|nr:MAG: glycosyl transferase [Candidatus Hydrogenedentota bacterium]